MPLNCEVVVKNKQGLHARPASLIVQLLANSASEVRFTHDKQTVDAKSILGLLTLAAPHGSRIQISISGEDEAKTKDQLLSFFESRAISSKGNINGS